MNEAAEAEAVLDGLAVPERESFNCVRACGAEVVVRPKLDCIELDCLDGLPRLWWPTEVRCAKCDRRWDRTADFHPRVAYRLLTKDGITVARWGFRSSALPNAHFNYVRKTS